MGFITKESEIKQSIVLLIILAVDDPTSKGFYYLINLVTEYKWQPGVGLDSSKAFQSDAQN